ncbi:TPA: calcium-transporting P-type ATPase, PMR1-type [Clostridium perfringens]|uniref:calcium-transporting P-type ATPase, PMR1-type n=1 Tax=Clostridium perfringens TaxID=1502 RepID=UPI0013E3FB5C|nr:calcium-transporting P-type ATPase, PMR1-type [Clostridium perfringens]EJT5930444.1 calcium-transporting P-type ATPase, PMR1-type [Clostridium perfringens]EJT6161707.1 calcium-transporting P-type ATPase, PMR1-type [Clostridium perfringens]EJT6504188.1 calcium-transporting P-type ATPase, PMR1-type [Clostridium perfringens]MBO3373080.1 calcium-transporting P-type ATPase, PMR1-type [Clostridium perfringens]MDH2473920.1 calcium-transporting P-type ATPase, PMR1-type [Clostridium perfringens]
MWYKKSKNEILQELDVDEKNGLSSTEALRRLEKYGKNKLETKKKKTLFKQFLSQLKDVMIYILIIAAIISAFLGEISDALIILLVIIINAVIGVIQESKAEKALDALKELSTPKALVKRDGSLKEILSEDIVPGDIVIIDAGRYIPGDLRLIDTANLKIEESAFTGESVPSEKDASFLPDKEIPIGDQNNMAFMSTLATYGRGVGVVVGTGMNTEIGKIAKMIEQEENDETPLQKKLSELGKILGFLAVGICILIFIISFFQGRDLLEMFLTSISLAVAAIPEGLPAIVAIVLALGVQRMVKKNAIIRKLPAVETLGSVSIICSDKTGTLTQNKMTVTTVYTNDSYIKESEFNLNDNESKLLVDCMVLCNDATYSEKSQTGDPTEIALLESPFKLNILKEKLEKEFKRIDEIPFDSDRKLMTTVNLVDDKKARVFTKGALDSILSICNKISINGKLLDFTKEYKAKVLENSNIMSDKALRVLAFAYKDISKENIVLDSLEKDLVFIGMVGMIDPPRLEVKDSIKLCKSAGITPVMITGDHKNTAFAIANELGIAEDISQAITGHEIDRFKEEEFNEKIINYRVFARVSPEHKVKIVKAFKSHGNIVSMTGDGVNDAPSLKAADIGVAMGITGTDVSKGASDMILTDDNFSTIVSAVEEGRKIYLNIKKSIVFLLSCNLGEILTLFTAILLNWNSPLQPIHILWVNLITDSFPALALGVDKTKEDVMNNPPRNPKESIFIKSDKIQLIINGVLIGGITLFAFKLGERLYADSLIHAQTMAFVVLSVSQLFLSLSLRSNTKSAFSLGIFSNKYLVYSILLGIFLQVIIISISFIANIFKVTPLLLYDWIVVILVSLIPFAINEILKLFRK